MPTGEANRINRDPFAIDASLMPNPDSNDEIEWWLGNNYGDHVNAMTWLWINDFRRSLSLIIDVCKSYEPIAAAASIRVIAEAALKDRPV